MEEVTYSEFIKEVETGTMASLVGKTSVQVRDFLDVVADTEVGKLVAIRKGKTFGTMRGTRLEEPIEDRIPGVIQLDYTLGRLLGLVYTKGNVGRTQLDTSYLRGNHVRVSFGWKEWDREQTNFLTNYLKENRINNNYQVNGDGTLTIVVTSRLFSRFIFNILREVHKVNMEEGVNSDFDAGLEKGREGEFYD